MSRSIWNCLYYIIAVVQWVAGVFGALAPASMKANVTGWPIAIQKFIAVVQAEAWWITPSSALLFGLCAFFRKVIGAPWVHDHLQFLLDRLQQTAFPPDKYDGGLHHHRATLFRRVKFCCLFRKWPWSGWLTAILRSGHATKSRRIRFLAPDDADKAEGVAGMAWVQNRAVLLQKLPDISSADADPKKVEEYAGATKVSLQALQKRRPGTRSIYAVPVEVRSRVWGVVVFDSRNQTISQREKIDDSFLLIGKYLGKLLEKL